MNFIELIKLFFKRLRNKQKYLMSNDDKTRDEDKEKFKRTLKYKEKKTIDIRICIGDG